MNGSSKVASATVTAALEAALSFARSSPTCVPKLKSVTAQNSQAASERRQHNHETKKPGEQKHLCSPVCAFCHNERATWYTTFMHMPLFPDLGPERVHTGLLFSGLVTAIVASSATAFATFLLKRWRTLEPAMRAYALVYVCTSLVWLCVTIRYGLLAFNIKSESALRLDEIVLEMFVYSTGLPLYYYLGLRVFNNRRVARSTAAIAGLLGLMALYWLIQPDGFATGTVTYFTADPTLNAVSLTLFGAFAGLALGLLFYDVFGRRWRADTAHAAPSYNSLYSLALVIYVGLGIIDQSKIIVGWPLVVFRILYAAAFLFGYLIVVQDETRREQYLVNEP